MHKDPERTTFISICGRQASLYHLLLTPSVWLLQEFKPSTDIYPCMHNLPHIRRSSKDSILQGLRWHPPYRQQALAPFPIVICLIDVSRHSKVWQQNSSHVFQFIILASSLSPHTTPLEGRQIPQEEVRGLYLRLWIENRGYHVKEGEKRSLKTKNQQSGLKLSTIYPSHLLLPEQTFSLFTDNLLLPWLSCSPKNHKLGVPVWPCLLLTPPNSGQPRLSASTISSQRISLLIAFSQTRLTSICPLCILHHNNIPLYKGSYVNRIIPLPVPTVFAAFSETVSHSLGQPRACHVAENDIELLIFLPLPPQVSEYIHYHN